MCGGDAGGMCGDDGGSVYGGDAGGMCEDDIGLVCGDDGGCVCEEDERGNSGITANR